MTLLDQIKAAAAVEAELERLNSEDRNLTAKAAIEEAVKQGGVQKEADLLAKVLKEGGPDAALVQPAVRRLMVATRNFSRTSVLRAERMSSYLGDATEVLARIGVSRASLMLYVIKALASEPIWGKQGSPHDLTAKIAAAKVTLADAYAKVESAITWSDISVENNLADQDRQNGLSVVAFVCTNNEVRLGDGRDLAQRLCSWWRANGEKHNKRAA